MNKALVVKTENLENHLAYMNGVCEDIDTVLSKVGLNNSGIQPVAKFSLEMRQHLAIARAIIHKLKLLIWDEPINGLDSIGILVISNITIFLIFGINEHIIHLINKDFTLSIMLLPF